MHNDWERPQHLLAFDISENNALLRTSINVNGDYKM
jgi:hypothetical protein